jgi:hypothetical protein
VNPIRRHEWFRQGRAASGWPPQCGDRYPGGWQGGRILCVGRQPGNMIDLQPRVQAYDHVMAAAKTRRWLRV